MNVCLIYPLLSRKRSSIDENKQYWPPLGLAYIAAVLENSGHRVKIIDRDLSLRKNKMSFEAVDKQTLDMVNEMPADIVGIGGTTPTFLDAAYTANLIKKDNPKRSIVFGGPHAAGEPILSLQECPAIDIVVRGEGEFSMLDIVSKKDLPDIQGITYRRQGTIISNDDRPLCPDLDQLPHPARHLLDMAFYTRPSRFTSRNLSLRTTSVFTARGCPYNCNYCAGPLMFQNKVRFHSPERVIAEINELVDKYNVEAVYFAEDMFLSSKPRAKIFMDLLVSSGLSKKMKWFAQIRSNVVDLELLGIMKQAGCAQVEYGFESGSQRILDLMGKRVKIEDNLRAARITRQAGVRFQANMIVGYPDETEDDFRASVNFIKKAKPQTVGFNIFMPLPGTAIYNKLKAEGKPFPGWDEIGDPEVTQTGYARMTKDRFEQLYLEARFKLILPLNLTYFIKDNLNNPGRLMRIIFSQFGGVLVKTWRALGRLRAIKRTPGKILFVSYNGVLDPVFQSQGITYLKKISSSEFNCFLFTFERKPIDESSVRFDLYRLGIGWFFLRYSGPSFLLTIVNVLRGNFYAYYLTHKHKISIVHARGLIPALISYFPARLSGKKFIFDIRSSLAKAYASAGYWKREGLIFKIMQRLEYFFIAHSDYLVVETVSHFNAAVKLRILSGKNPAIEVIPCCVDLDRFSDPLFENNAQSAGVPGELVKIIYIGSLSGWYLIDEMINFYKVFHELFPKSEFTFYTADKQKIKDVVSADESLRQSCVVDFVDYGDLPASTMKADAGVVFSKPGDRLESMPIKIGEYLASGLPVIVNKGMGDAEYILLNERVGVIVEDLELAAYRKAARELERLLKEGPELKKRCRETAKKLFSADQGTRSYLSIYRSLDN